MSKEQFNVNITIICNKDDESGFEFSLDEAVKKIKEGYLSGMDGNEDEEYTFGVHRFPLDNPLMEFKEQAIRLISKFEDLLKGFKDDGDTSETSQKIVLQKAINEVSYAINGTEEIDFKKGG